MMIMRLNPVLLLCCCLFSGGILHGQADLPFAFEWKVGKTYWLDVRQEERKDYTPNSYEESIHRTLWAFKVLKKNANNIVLQAKIERLRTNNGIPDFQFNFDSKYYQREDDYQFWNASTKSFIITVDVQGRVLHHQLLKNGKVIDAKNKFENPVALWELAVPQLMDENKSNSQFYIVPTFIRSPQYQKTETDPFLSHHFYENNQHLTIDRDNNWIKYGAFNQKDKNINKKIWLRGWTDNQAQVKGQLTNFKTQGALKEKEYLLSYLLFRFGLKGKLNLNTDGSFELTAPLSGLVSFDLLGVPLILSPGDRLEVRANLDSIEKTTYYKGNCSQENKLWHKFYFREGHLNEDSEKFLDIMNKNAEVGILHRDVRQDFIQDSILLSAWQDRINPFHYWDFYWHYRYMEASRMFIFSGNYHFPETARLEPKSFLPRFNRLPIFNDWCEQGYEYSNFLQYRYMPYLASSLRKFNIYSSNLPHEGVYPLAKYMLSAEPLERVLYDHLSSSFSFLRYEDQANMYAECQDFIQFSKNPVFKANISKFLTTLKSLNQGQKLPDFEVYNIKGQSLNANKLHGKKTILHLELGNYSFGSIEYAKLAKRYPSLRIVHVYPLPYREFKQKFSGKNLPPPYTEDNLFFPKDLEAAQLLHDRFCFNESSKWEESSYKRLYFVNEAGVIADFIDNNSNDSRQIRADFAYRLQPFLSQKSALKPQFTWLYILLANLLLVGTFLALRTRYIRRREARKRRLTEIELKSLRAQLNPHFIFNTMGSIQHLIASQQSEKANDYLADLAALMRLVLRATQKGIISLRDELDLVEQYCALENLRKPFTLHLDIAPELDVNACEVPALLLQPYVENAILHGLAPVNAGGEIKLQLWRDGSYVVIFIQDNGVGIHQARQKNSNGTQSGLKMNQERLQLMYGAEASVHIVDLAEKDPMESGTTVTLKLPCC
jgi:anti-sigma regulatory factor (Ser/Thr protein kinase)